jgi:hypothetical protein
MAYRARSPVSIEHAPQWLAVIRIGVGLYFVKSLVTKMSIVLLGGFLPFPAVSDRWIHVMPTIVTKQASDNPILFYKHFLENTVLTHVNLFAHLTAWGETVVGLGLTLGSERIPPITPSASQCASRRLYTTQKTPSARQR